MGYSKKKLDYPISLNINISLLTTNKQAEHT